MSSPWYLVYAIPMVGSGCLLVGLIGGYIIGYVVGLRQAQRTLPSKGEK